MGIETIKRYTIEQAEKYAMDLCLKYLRKARNYKFWYYLIIIAVSVFTLIIGIVINQSDISDPVYLEKIKKTGLVMVALEFVQFIVAILALFKQWRINENAGISIKDIIRKYDGKEGIFKSEATRKKNLYDAVRKIEETKHKAYTELGDQIQQMVEKQQKNGGSHE